MPAPHPFNLPPFLRDLRRSRDGLLLGVFRGSAEAKGWSILWTRVIGTVALLGLSGAFTGDFGLSRLLLAAFFYLILAVILPLEEGRAGDGDATLKGDFAAPRRRSSWCGWTGSRKVPAESEPFAVRRETSLRVPSRLGTDVPRGDLSELAARLERLSRRVQRIEGVVTGPEYDWERRLRS